MQPTPQTIETELETLATMLHSSARHMSNARTGNGSHVWSFTAMGDVFKDALDGFYLIRNQLAPNAGIYV
jgi:tRNA U38,U39,U40 pseudouridine synthase TruA